MGDGCSFEICFGTMTFSGEGWLNGVIGNLGQKEATSLIEKSLKAGVNFLDTADVYSIGQSEIMTGQASRYRARSDVVLRPRFGRWGPQEPGSRANHGRVPKPDAKTSHDLPDSRHRSGNAGGRNHGRAERPDVRHDRTRRFPGAWRIAGSTPQAGWPIEMGYYRAGRDLDRLVP